MIRSGDNNTKVDTARKLTENNGPLASSKHAGIHVRAVITIRKKIKENILEKIEDNWESLMSGIGRGILIKLISQDIDPGQCSISYCVL